MALARETQLMFTYTEGFSPIGSELSRWKGEILVKIPQGERAIPVEVLVPLKYPEYPPKVIVLEKNIQHPNIEKNGNVLLKITHEWKPDVHVYQVIHALQNLFKKVPPQFTDTAGAKIISRKATVQTIDSAKSANQQKVDTVNQTITSLQDEIKAKDDELRKLRAELVKGSNEKIAIVLPKDKAKSEKLMIQAKSIAIADLLSTLDEKFKDGEISPVDFSKLYRKYTKELYLIHKELESK